LELGDLKEAFSCLFFFYHFFLPALLLFIALLDLPSDFLSENQLDLNLCKGSQAWIETS